MAINPTLNPRAVEVSEAHDLNLDSGRYVVVSIADWSQHELHLGYTDDVRKACDVAEALTPIVPGETFAAKQWNLR